MKQQSVVLKVGLIALAVLLVVFALTRFAGTEDEQGLGQTPPPRADGPVLPPLDDKYIIGKNPNSTDGGPTPVKK
jgi:hypothetical protein